VIEKGVVEAISGTTLWEWLHEERLRPWTHRPWIFHAIPTANEPARVRGPVAAAEVPAAARRLAGGVAAAHHLAAVFGPSAIAQVPAASILRHGRSRDAKRRDCHDQHGSFHIRSTE